MQYCRRQRLSNQNEKDMSKAKNIEEYGKSINKEFIPIFFILIIPVFSLFEGYGIRKIEFCCKDLFYLIPVIIGFLIHIYDRKKFLNLYFFITVFILWILKNMPILFVDRYFNGNYAMLIISDCIIVFFYFFISVSYWVNDPYFVSYYKSNLKSYIIIYKIFAVYFLGIAITHLILFIKIYYILKTIY
jgi:hypothetical protein